MEEVFKQALEKMIKELELLIEEVNKNPLIEKIKQKKKLINEFSLHYSGNIIYADVNNDLIAKSADMNINPGQFKGMTLAKAVRIYLNMRGKENPPLYSEILDALKMGDFDSKKISDIRSALLKNNQVCLLRDDHFGLMEWYGSVKKKSSKEGTKEEEEIDEKTEEEITEQTGEEKTE